MKNSQKFSALLAFIIVCSFNTYAQNDITKTERYIEISNLESFFTTSSDYPNEIVCSFELHNIFEHESSKPAFVAVNELSNVTKFSIKSRSEKYENQRSCYLRMQKQNYFSTFGLVLKNIEIKYILFEGNFIETDEFLKNNL